MKARIAALAFAIPCAASAATALAQESDSDSEIAWDWGAALDEPQAALGSWDDRSVADVEADHQAELEAAHERVRRSQFRLQASYVMLAAGLLLMGGGAASIAVAVTDPPGRPPVAEPGRLIADPADWNLAPVGLFTFGVLAAAAGVAFTIIAPFRIRRRRQQAEEATRELDLLLEPTVSPTGDGAGLSFEGEF